jgi:uncharacterized lipoprotein YbaY
VDVTAGPDAGTVIASTSIKNPGPQPVKYQLAYPFAIVDGKDDYRVYSGIADGDSAWVTPAGVPVDVPQPELTGVKLQLEYRPDLLKGAVSGTITGAGLDPAQDPNSYGTSLVIDVNTGATIGFQLISPAGNVPIPYSVPYDPGTITQDASYVARGSVWDGTTLWNSPAGVPVITNDNPKSDVVLTVVPAVPAPAPSGDSGIGTWGLLLLLLAVIGIVIAVVYVMRQRNAAAVAAAGGPDAPPPPPGPAAPPPPPGPAPTEPPPPPADADGAAQPDAAAGDADAAAEPDAVLPDATAEPAADAGSAADSAGGDTEAPPVDGGEASTDSVAEPDAPASPGDDPPAR